MDWVNLLGDLTFLTFLDFLFEDRLFFFVGLFCAFWLFLRGGEVRFCFELSNFWLSFFVGLFLVFCLYSRKDEVSSGFEPSNFWLVFFFGLFCFLSGEGEVAFCLVLPETFFPSFLIGLFPVFLIFMFLCLH